jgi:hypothetical protein
VPLRRWTPKEQTFYLSGYTSWDVIAWAREDAFYYDACCAEWKESGALHFTGRGTLDDFLQVRTTP